MTGAVPQGQADGRRQCVYCGETIPEEAEFCPFCGQEHPFSRPPSSDNVVDQLDRLVAMRQSGMLDDDEFKKAKSKLLGT